MYRYQGISATLIADLQVRYGGSCTFSTTVFNVFNNYYSLKNTALGPTIGGTASGSGVVPRVTTVESNINTLNSTVDPNLPSVFSTINSNLAPINSITDPTFGALGGMNCSVIGEDTLRVRDTACGEMIDHMYIARIAIGITSYLLLLGLCCTSCFGNRHSRKM